MRRRVKFLSFSELAFSGARFVPDTIRWLSDYFQQGKNVLLATVTQRLTLLVSFEDELSCARYHNFVSFDCIINLNININI